MRPRLRLGPLVITSLGNTRARPGTARPRSDTQLGNVRKPDELSRRAAGTDGYAFRRPAKVGTPCGMLVRCEPPPSPLHRRWLRLRRSMSDGGVVHRFRCTTVSSWPTPWQVQASRRGLGIASQMLGYSSAQPAWLATCCRSVQRHDAAVCWVSLSCLLGAVPSASRGAQDRSFRGPRRHTSTTLTSGTTGGCVCSWRAALCCLFADIGQPTTDQHVHT